MVVYNKHREALDVTIRLAGQDDVPDIMTLLIKQHGNYYPYADLYSMDFVRSAIQRGDIYIVVAELADGLIAGMTGANGKTQFAGTTEWIMLTIRPSCRGYAIGKLLVSALPQVLPPELRASTYGHCMSLDTASQKILAGLGHHITGALLNSYRLDTHAENLSGLDIPVKHNLLVTCLPGNKKDAGHIFAPPAHAGYIRTVYETLGVRYTLEDREGTEPPAASSVCAAIQKEEHRYCEIFVREIGLDLAGILEDTLKQYGAVEEQSFNAFISLHDPGAPWAYRIFEERGFSFAGIHALSGPEEYMILQYSPALPVPFDRIAVLPDFAGEFSYIRDRHRGTMTDAH
jgi:ribosomal protein S18 acetylase RimI-like enzyme